MKKEINRIAMGSVDIYMLAFAGTSVSDIPTDETIETEENLIGRTKDGGEITYTTEYYNVKSDDGKASRSEMTDDKAEFSFGLITWNGNTITKLVATAESAISGTKRRTLIGGITNANGTLYLVRAVHKDKVKGDIRYTMLGKNIAGFAAAYKPGKECTITPNIEGEPFDNGRLVILDESDVVGVSLNQHNAEITESGSVTLTATTSPESATVTWTSNDTDNATVSNGVVSGVSEGTATISASITVSGTTYTDRCVVTVKAAE